jgi:hypothetical protein
MSNLNDRIEALLEEEMSVAKIRATLILEDFKLKDINKAIKAAELITPRESFKADFYDWLVEAPRTVEEATEYVNENGSDNVVKHLSAHLLVTKLVIKLRESLETPDEE